MSSVTFVPYNIYKQKQKDKSNMLLVQDFMAQRTFEVGTIFFRGTPIGSNGRYVI